ncbi:MAG: hypothetical protein KDA58_12705, partial [Planctomycetaceae bacterium]|nr:hypothetical protein [Planctomycetaceae bacterium]
EVRLLLGEEAVDWSTNPPMTPWLPEEGEWPEIELERALGDALRFVVQGDRAAGIKLLTEWDQRLTQQECQKEWFEVRLRLIAAYLLDDKRNRAEPLARGLEAKAAEANDFLTLRRLKRLLDPNTQPVPIPVLADYDAGPFANGTATSATPSADESGGATSGSEVTVDTTDDSTPVTAPDDNDTPLKAEMEQLMEQILEARQQEEPIEPLRAAREAILGYDISSIVSPRDGAMLIHLARFTVTGPEDARSVWAFAQRMLEHFSQEATVISVYADLGLHFHNVDEEEFAEITHEELERLFRKSLMLDPEKPRNFLRAAGFFEQVENLGEAERCYARAFRLDRTDAESALNLARIYRDTDRPRDALAALDLALREGCENADVAWEAALAAYGLEQFDSQLTYLDRHVALGENHVWVEYYRAWALLELGRYEECLAAIEREREFEPPGELHLQLLRAAALAQLDRDDEAATEIMTLLQSPLSEVEYLSISGIVRNFTRVWIAIADWPAEHPARLALEQRLLEAGLMSDEYFHHRRESDAETEVNFYRVRLRQATGDDWGTHAGCLPGQQEWPYYQIEWGVLATTEEEAVDRVLQQHHSGLDLPVEVQQVELAGEGFTDRPGVVWQGYRWCDDAPDAEDLFFGMDFDDDEGEEFMDDSEE